ncbi:DUF364 domain-containing protein [Alkaliphilus oremlandii]|uniref:Fis family transcriptional regulator n=1 Tax=Alkaliphilus oremlandii (strain OhILAs) TaxID=350688 RepID=A8MKV9_ALKOO|nr:DUF364 domain-containing protein [Alkaliphilus oremlandii]ABW17776.1 conserved hypothetical protein [Alkaliphilus oremlandii OhILAs]
MGTQSNEILNETIDQIRAVFGEEMNHITVERVTVGLFFTGVKLNNGEGGICFTPIKDIPQGVCCPSSAKEMPLSGKMVGKNVEYFIEGMFKGSVLRKAIGIAVLNALSATCWNQKNYSGNYEIIHNADPVDENTSIPQDKTVTVVGALLPYIKMLKKNKNKFFILELAPETLKADELDHFVPNDRAQEALGQSDLIIITGTTIINDTLEGLISMAKEGAEIIVVGPTASMLPDAFFKRGIKKIGSIAVTKSDELLDILAEAGSGYHFFGKSANKIVIAEKNSI